MNASRKGRRDRGAAAKAKKAPFIRNDLIERANKEFAQRVIALPNGPELGTAFSLLKGAELSDALVTHRIRSKFDVVDPEKGKLRRDKSVRDMLNYDASHETICWRNLSADDRRTFLGARDYLARGLSTFKLSYVARFPSNETLVSAMGDTSLLQKLSDLEQWTVSPDCVEYACKIAWHNKGLKKMVKAHFRDRHAWRFLQAHWAEECPEGKHKAYYVFSHMFRALVTINGVSRVTTVPKDNDKDRVITCEPLWNMICQLSLAADLRRCMESTLGVRLQDTQDYHKFLVSLGVCTVDMKNASNSNWWEVVRDLFPARIVRLISACRTGVAEYNGEYYPLHMMAPMGCGFTFEIMTLTLLSYVQQFDTSGSVYGDDIIIRKPDVVPSFLAFVRKMGWQVNESKTFLAGNFRESCGAFYDCHSGEYILSYDFPPFEGVTDVIVALNKLRLLWMAGKLSNVLETWIIETWWVLAKLFPADLFCTPAVTLQGESIDFKDLTSQTTLKERESLLTQQLHRRVELGHAKLIITSGQHPVQGKLPNYAREQASLFELRNAVRRSGDRQVRVIRCDKHGTSEFHNLTLCSVLNNTP